MYTDYILQQLNKVNYQKKGTHIANYKGLSESTVKNKLGQMQDELKERKSAAEALKKMNSRVYDQDTIERAQSIIVEIYNDDEEGNDENDLRFTDIIEKKKSKAISTDSSFDEEDEEVKNQNLEEVKEVSEDDDDPIDPSLPDEEKDWIKQVREVQKKLRPPQLNEIAALYIELMNFPEIKNEQPMIRPPRCPEPPVIKIPEPEPKKEVPKPVKEYPKVKLILDANGIPLPPPNMPVLPPLPVFDPSTFVIKKEEPMKLPERPSQLIADEKKDFMCKNAKVLELINQAINFGARDDDEDEDDDDDDDSDYSDYSD